jgi:hypothetical protein
MPISWAFSQKDHLIQDQMHRTEAAPGQRRQGRAKTTGGRQRAGRKADIFNARRARRFFLDGCPEM